MRIIDVRKLFLEYKAVAGRDKDAKTTFIKRNFIEPIEKSTIQLASLGNETEFQPRSSYRNENNEIVIRYNIQTFSKETNNFFLSL